MLLQGVREVSALASPSEPQAVSGRAFDRALTGSHEHADLPAARQIARELKLTWPEVLEVAHAPERLRSSLLDLKARGNAPPGWLTDERIRYALRLVARRLGVDSLTTIAYDAERKKLLAEDRRDWLHGRRLRLPSANVIRHATHGWDAAQRIAGLGTHAQQGHPIHQVIVPRVEVMDRFHDHYGHQPSEVSLRDFARGNKIPMSTRGGRKHSETVAEWRQRRRDRGLPEPRVVNHRLVKAPDYSADVGAAKPGEYPHRGKWGDEDYCVAWVAHHLAGLPLRNLGGPNPRRAQAQHVPATRRLERGVAQGRGTTQGAGGANGSAHTRPRANRNARAGRERR
jgi:hypothetical protein